MSVVYIVIIGRSSFIAERNTQPSYIKDFKGIFQQILQSVLDDNAIYWNSHLFSLFCILLSSSAFVPEPLRYLLGKMFCNRLVYWNVLLFKWNLELNKKQMLKQNKHQTFYCVIDNRFWLCLCFDRFCANFSNSHHLSYPITICDIMLEWKWNCFYWKILN